MGRNVYAVKYRMHFADEVRMAYVIASNKAEAYDVATYEEIPRIHKGDYPYSTWVYSVTSQNGNYRRFNTSEGNAY